MIELLEVRNSQGNILALPLDDPSNGFVIADIDGLDPVKATISSSSFAQIDGEQYHSSRREARNLKLKLELEPDYIETSVRDLRNRLYKFFMPKTQADLRFYLSDGLTVSVSGRIETFVSPLFAKEPKVDISIICFNPDFVDTTAVTLNGMTTSGTEETLVPYSGSIESGFWIILNANRNVSGFTFYHRLPDGTVRIMDYGGSLVSGDILTISTNRGNKGATLTRGGTHYSALNDISPQSSWHEFFEGENYIRVQTDGDPVPYEIVFTNKYGGL